MRVSREPRIDVRQIDSIEPRKRGAASGQVRARSIEQPRAERLHHAGAGIDGGTAADAQDDLAAAAVEGRRG